MAVGDTDYRFDEIVVAKANRAQHGAVGRTRNTGRDELAAFIKGFVGGHKRSPKMCESERLYNGSRILTYH